MVAPIGVDDYSGINPIAKQWLLMTRAMLYRFVSNQYTIARSHTTVTPRRYNGNNERPTRVRYALWTPNKKMESKNEEIHIW